MVVMVRDPNGRATDVVERMLGALTTDDTLCEPLPVEVDPLSGGGDSTQWDTCGRKR